MPPPQRLSLRGAGIMASVRCGDADDDTKSEHKCSLLYFLSLVFPLSPQWPPCPSSDTPGAPPPQDCCMDWYPCPDHPHSPTPSTASLKGAFSGRPPRPPVSQYRHPLGTEVAAALLHRLPRATPMPTWDLFTLSSPLACKLPVGEDFVCCAHTCITRTVPGA